MSVDPQTRIADALDRLATAQERIADALDHARPDGLLTVEDVAGELGIAEKKVRSWIDSGLLPALNLADDRKNLRVTRADLTAALELRRIEPRPAHSIRRAPRRPEDRY